MDVSTWVVAIGIISIIILISLIPLFVLSIIGEYKLFEKCGEKGWKSLIPFYNDWTLVEISGCHKWYFLFIIANSFLTVFIEEIDRIATLSLLSGLVSLITLYIIFCINYNIAKKFNQGFSFAIGMCFVPFIFYFMLGFSTKYKYDKNVEVNPWGLYDFKERRSVIKKEKKYCSKCGLEMTNNFCPKCGNSKKGE